MTGNVVVLADQKPPTDDDLRVVVALARAILRDESPHLPINHQLDALSVGVLAMAERLELK